MSAQVTNQNFTNIGRMFARQSVPAVYGRQKEAAAAPDETAGAVDSVSLSPFAPKPLSAGMFEEAMDVGRTMDAGGRLPTGTAARLREDRIFAAMSALAVMGLGGVDTGLSLNWPGGIPVPTPEEMEVARRRLAQRLDNVSEARDETAVQNDRLELLRKIGKRNFFATTSDESERTAAIAASS